ncbi:hypothetical protein BOTBODRAFT_191420 [Botryobasidium botryosum FD-172 SS1]|uniref:Uncharacterized protein n=1 Tax=Botryobasidium botryosum (strain FD-172 SS1) TaxID=930990 RepID=A0A067LZS2_BOTB1|nr:hypothetical protein BOTBODRAFT_191420 [Botryobasidium botryosum FD-172 SS1]
MATISGRCTHSAHNVQCTCVSCPAYCPLPISKSHGHLPVSSPARNGHVSPNPLSHLLLDLSLLRRSRPPLLPLRSLASHPSRTIMRVYIMYHGSSSITVLLSFSSLLNLWLYPLYLGPYPDLHQSRLIDLDSAKYSASLRAPALEPSTTSLRGFDPPRLGAHARDSHPGTLDVTPSQAHSMSEPQTSPDSYPRSPELSLLSIAPTVRARQHSDSTLIAFIANSAKNYHDARTTSGHRSGFTLRTHQRYTSATVLLVFHSCCLHVHALTNPAVTPTRSTYARCSALPGPADAVDHECMTPTSEACLTPLSSLELSWHPIVSTYSTRQ